MRARLDAALAIKRGAEDDGPVAKRWASKQQAADDAELEALAAGKLRSARESLLTKEELRRIDMDVVRGKTAKGGNKNKHSAAAYERLKQARAEADADEREWSGMKRSELRTPARASNPRLATPRGRPHT